MLSLCRLSQFSIIFSKTIDFLHFPLISYFGNYGQTLGKGVVKVFFLYDFNITSNYAFLSIFKGFPGLENIGP